MQMRREKRSLPKEETKKRQTGMKGFWKAKNANNSQENRTNAESNNSKSVQVVDV